MKILTLIHCRYYQVWTFKPAIILYIFFSSLIMLSVYFRLDGNRYGVWCFWPSWSRRDVPHAASWYGKYYIAIWFCFVSSSDPNDCERCCHLLWAVVIFCEVLSLLSVHSLWSSVVMKINKLLHFNLFLLNYWPN